MILTKRLPIPAWIFLLGLLLSATHGAAATGSSTRQEALDYLLKTKLPDSSIYWPNIRCALFIENLKANILAPLALNQGTNTNFCGYAALSYIPLNEDPLTYTRFLMDLYSTGQATWGAVHFNPSTSIHLAAGTLRFKGILDIRPADQLWFLVLADHYRSYLNFFTRHFHPGAEDTFWAAVNYGKFNRIIHELFGYNVQAKGSDLIRPHLPDLFGYLTESIGKGLTYLYVNNTYLHKKNHNKFKGNFPTHFIVLTSIRRIPDGQIPGEQDMVDIVYWDYGGRTQRQVNLHFLKKITYGVSVCIKERPPPVNSPPSPS
jgi:hypothetical protein